MTPVLLDITRLTSPSALKIPTGIDRVVRVYVQHLLSGPRECLFLGRIGGGAMVLLDAKGISLFLSRLDGQQNWSGLDAKGRAQVHRDKSLRTLEAELRRHALWHGPLSHLANTLKKLLNSGYCYLNTGHSNVERDVTTAVKKGGAGRIVFMLHDTIPLDHPQWQTPLSVERFTKVIATISEAADTVIANSHHTAKSARYWLTKAGRCPQIVTAHLGIEPACDVPAYRQETPYFVQLGTIEPRKGHALSVAIWEEMYRQDGAICPHLFVIGKRGWMNGPVFEKLDHSPLMNRQIFEIGACSDSEKTAFLKGSTGLLFPSQAEGFGLPILEAAQLNIPAIATDLPVYHEFTGLDILYMDNRDVHNWMDAIKTLLKRGTSTPVSAYSGSAEIPSWQRHFATVEPFL